MAINATYQASWPENYSQPTRSQKIRHRIYTLLTLPLLGVPRLIVSYVTKNNFRNGHAAAEKEIQLINQGGKPYLLTTPDGQNIQAMCFQDAAVAPKKALIVTLPGPIYYQGALTSEKFPYYLETLKKILGYQKDVAIIVYNQRGSGLCREGTPNQENYLQDLLTVYSWVFDNGNGLGIEPQNTLLHTHCASSAWGVKAVKIMQKEHKASIPILFDRSFDDFEKVGEDLLYDKIKTKIPPRLAKLIAKIIGLPIKGILRDSGWHVHTKGMDEIEKQIIIYHPKDELVSARSSLYQKQETKEEIHFIEMDDTQVPDDAKSQRFCTPHDRPYFGKEIDEIQSAVAKVLHLQNIQDFPSDLKRQKKWVNEFYATHDSNAFVNSKKETLLDFIANSQLKDTRKKTLIKHILGKPKSKNKTKKWVRGFFEKFKFNALQPRTQKMILKTLDKEPKAQLKKMRAPKQS